MANLLLATRESDSLRSENPRMSQPSRGLVLVVPDLLLWATLTGPLAGGRARAPRRALRDELHPRGVDQPDAFHGYLRQSPAAGGPGSDTSRTEVAQAMSDNGVLSNRSPPR